MTHQFYHCDVDYRVCKNISFHINKRKKQKYTILFLLTNLMAKLEYDHIFVD